MSDWSDDETDDPHYADRRNFYKVEKWSRDGLRVELMLYAGNNLDKARRIFADYITISVSRRPDDGCGRSSVSVSDRDRRRCPNALQGEVAGADQMAHRLVVDPNR